MCRLTPTALMHEMACSPYYLRFYCRVEGKARLHQCFSCPTYKRFQKVMRRARLKVTFAYALRATSVTMLASSGVNQAQLCLLMGWTDLATANRYVRTAQARENAIVAMEKAFN